MYKYIDKRTPRYIHNQGKLVNCCSSIAVVICMEILDAKKHSGKYTKLSPLYNYYKARTDTDDATEKLTLNEAINSAIQHGVAPQSLHNTPKPITLVAAHAKPTDAAQDMAKNYRIFSTYDDTTGRFLGYYTCSTDGSDSVAQWEKALARGNPIAITFAISNEYDQLSSSEEQEYLYKPDISSLDTENRHSVIVVGYDNSQQYFIILDSRGQKFCDRGCWRMPYSVVLDGIVVREAIVIDILN